MISKSQVPEGHQAVAYDDNRFVATVGDTIRWASYIKGEPDLASRELTRGDTPDGDCVYVICTILVVKRNTREFRILLEICDTWGGEPRVV